MLTFVDGTGREQSVQDVLHLHRLVKGGVIQDSTLLACAEELRWAPAISSAYIARSKNSLNMKEISRRGLPYGQDPARHLALLRSVVHQTFIWPSYKERWKKLLKRNFMQGEDGH
jgi:hypothetical protein